jgi:uncharacterized coiled-coil protein SlyX
MDGENQNPAPDAGAEGGAPQVITLTPAEYEALRGAAQAQHQQKLTADQRIEQLEGAYKAEKLSSALGDVLAGQRFISPHAAQQAKQLLANRAELKTVDGVPTVFDRTTGKPMSQSAAAALASPEFSHFLAAPGRGGSGGTNPSPSGSWDNNQQPTTIAELNEMCHEQNKKFKLGTGRNPFLVPR